MVIETFKPGKTDEVYERFEKKGRLLPTGLKYIDSWLSIDRKKCFQLMETENFDLFDEWISNWNDLTDFEIIPVEDSPTKSALKKRCTGIG
jgi:hypothetical protein